MAKMTQYTVGNDTYDLSDAQAAHLVDLGTKTITTTQGYYSFPISTDDAAALVTTHDGIRILSHRRSVYRPSEYLIAFKNGTTAVNGVASTIYTGTVGNADFTSKTVAIVIPISTSGTGYIQEGECDVDIDELMDEFLFEDESVSDKEVFLTRQTNCGANTQMYPTMIGATMAWNQQFKTKPTETANGLTYTKIDEQHFSVSGTVTTAFSYDQFYVGQTQQFYRGTHKYILISRNISYPISISGFDIPRSNSAIFMLSGTGTWTGAPYVRASLGSQIDITNGTMFICDLTLALTPAIADYAYSLEQSTAGSGIAWLKSHGFLKNGYYSFDAGSLQGVNISGSRSTGFNQWDEVWELGAFNTSTGNNYNSTTQFRSKNYVPIAGGLTYYFKGSSGMWFGFFDANKSMISGYDTTGALSISNNCVYLQNITFKIPDNACYFRFYTINYASYNNDICINISDPAKNGTYEPYQSNFYPIPSVTLNGIYKLDSNNNLYADGDIRYSDGRVERKYGKVTYVGAVSENWSLQSINSYNIANFYIVPPVPNLNSVTAGVVSNRFEKQTTVIANTETEGIYLSLNTIYVRIQSSKASTVAEFKTWLSNNNLEIVYELATPTIEQVAPFQSPQVIYDGGTQTFTDAGFEASTRDVEVPPCQEATYMSDSRSTLQQIVNTPSTDGKYHLVSNVTGGTPEFVWENNSGSDYFASVTGGNINIIDATFDGFTFNTGVKVVIRPTSNATSALALQLRINDNRGTTYSPVYLKYKGENVPTLNANVAYELVYDGTNFNIVGEQNTDKWTQSYNNIYPSTSGLTILGENVRAKNVCYGVCNFGFSGTATEIVIKTGIKFISSVHMPTVYLKGWSFTPAQPIDLSVSFYIFQDAFNSPRVINKGTWRPAVRLFSYTRNSELYVAIGLIGSTYYPSFSVDVQSDIINTFNYITTNPNYWTTAYVQTGGTSIIPAIGTDNCVNVSYALISSLTLGSPISTCDNTAASTAKSISNNSQVSGFTLTDGATVTVKFTYGNTATGTVSLDAFGTGPIQIAQFSNGTLEGDFFNLGAGAIVTFTYLGGYWQVTAIMDKSWKPVWGRNGLSAVRPIGLTGTINRGSIVNAYVESNGNTMLNDINHSGEFSFIMSDWDSMYLTGTTTAGSTSYTLRSSYKILPLEDFWFMSYDAPYTKLQPTTVVINNDDTITLTFASSLNPTTSITSLRYVTTNGAFGCLTFGPGVAKGQRSITHGSAFENKGNYSILTGTMLYNAGGCSALFGWGNYNTRSYSLIAGDSNTNRAYWAFLAGLGHDSTNGPEAVAAVGKYSLIDSTSAFVVGNGTGVSARSNAFEVSTTGVAKAGGRRVVTSPNSTAVGNVTTPVYIDTNGYPQTCTLDSGFAKKENSHYYGICNTAAATAAKEVTVQYAIFDTPNLVEGTTIAVKFTYGNSAGSIALSVNGTTSKFVVRRINTSNFETININMPANAIYEFTYDGTYWNLNAPLSLPNLNNSSTRLTSANRSIPDGGLEYLMATSSMTTGKPPIDSHILHMNWDNTTLWAAQLAVGNGDGTNAGSAGRLFTRGQYNSAGNWSNWYEVPRFISTPSNGQPLVYDTTNGAGFIKGGTIDGSNIAVQSTASLASGDGIPVIDVSDGNKLKNMSINFNGNAYSPLCGDGGFRYPYEMVLQWGPTSIAKYASVTPIGMAVSSAHSANRIAYVNPEAIKVEYSADAGSTWTDSGLSDGSKTALVTDGMAVNVPLGRAANDTTTAFTLDSRLRITLSASTPSHAYYFYTSIKKTLINVSTAVHMTVVVETRTGANYNDETKWVTYGTYNDLSGWSGWNDIPTTWGSFGGGLTQTSQVWQVRFTFRPNAVSSGSPTTCYVYGIRIFGDTDWSCPSNLARWGHIYSVDTAQNATFPATVTANYVNVSNHITANGNIGAIGNISGAHLYGQGAMYYGTCATAAATALKEISCTGFTLTTGSRIAVRFNNGNTTTTALRFKVNGTGGDNGITVVRIGAGGEELPVNDIAMESGVIHDFMYNGTYWVMMDYPALPSLGTYSTTVADANRSIKNGGLEYFVGRLSYTAHTPLSSLYHHIINLNWENNTIYGAQISVAHGNSDANASNDAGRLWVRGQYGANGYWGPWREVPRLTVLPANDGDLIVADGATSSLVKGVSTIGSHKVVADQAYLQAGDALVVASYNNSWKLSRTTTTFGSDTTKFLCNTGSFAVPNALKAIPATTLDGQTAIDDFLTANLFQYGLFINADSTLGFGSNDGFILSLPWSNTAYGAQIAVDDNATGGIKYRQKSNTWGAWRTILHSGNYTSYFTDTKVTQTAITGSSTTEFYPVLLAKSIGQTATTTDTANFTANVSVTPSGDLYANNVVAVQSFKYGSNAHTTYNSTLKAIEFIFD